MGKIIKSILLKTLVCLLFVAIIMAVFTMVEIKRLQRLPANRTEDNFIFTQTPVRKDIYYSGCNHLESVTATGDEEFAQKSFEELQEAGWYVFWAEDGQAVAYKEVDGHCPDDRQKSYLAIYEGNLALFNGPRGTAGEPVEFIDIDLTRLPENWQLKLTNGGIEFQNEAEKLSALESLDELRQ